jgi:hypothetical protein
MLLIELFLFTLTNPLSDRKDSFQRVTSHSLEPASPNDPVVCKGCWNRVLQSGMNSVAELFGFSFMRKSNSPCMIVFSRSNIAELQRPKFRNSGSLFSVYSQKNIRSLCLPHMFVLKITIGNSSLLSIKAFQFMFPYSANFSLHFFSASP